MATLTAHLRCSGDHGHLPFHPDCPVCRAERLCGTLPERGLVGRRAQAAMVAGMLAASTAAPTVAAAQEADQVTEGAVEPAQAGGDSAGMDFDPGGDADDLPFDGPDVPDPDAGTGAPDVVESEPVTDVAAPVADTGDEPEPTATPAPQVEPTSTSAPVPAPAPKVHTLSAPDRAASPKLALEATVGAQRSARVRSTRPPSAVGAEGPERVRAMTPPARPADVSGTPAVRLVSEAATKTREAGSDNGRYYVVAAGESLWSIARDLVGRDASPARIAREVNRLWQVNSGRIATGDPDLLRVGTKLALR